MPEAQAVQAAVHPLVAAAEVADQAAQAEWAARQACLTLMDHLAVAVKARGAPIQLAAAAAAGRTTEAAGTAASQMAGAATE